MNIVFLSIGSNIGNKTQNLLNAIGFIGNEIGRIEKVSAVYATEPWGLKQQPEFLNMALLVTTQLNAEEVLKKALSIELKMGRVREQKMGARSIDIDILLFNDEIIREDNLSVPHPFMQQRNFVLMPLNEIAAEIVHPVLKKTIRELLEESSDTSLVNKTAGNLLHQPPSVDTNLE